MSKAIQWQTAYLDSNISNIEDEIIVRDLNDIYWNQVVFVEPIMYLTIEPLSSTNQEIISCTGIEVVSDTKVRLTGVVRWLAAQPGVAGTARSHGANLEIILTNNPQFYDGIGFLDEAEVVTAPWDFEVSPTVPTPTTWQQAVNKDFAEWLANQGAADASTTTKGISRLSASPTTTLGTATVTVASPAVVTLASHGLTANDSIQFTTTGALPTGLLPSVTYYVIAAGLTSSEFELSLTLAGAAINTTGTQSGTHTLYKTTPVAVGVNDTKMLTQDENNAAAGAGGSPSSSNLFETQNDTSNASTKTATTISFAAGSKTISDSGNGFVTANFRQGTQITVAWSASNNGTFTIVSVAAGAIVVAESLVNESAWATVVMTTVSANKLLRLDSTWGIPPISWLYSLSKIFWDASDGTVVFDGSSTILTLVPSSSIYTMTRDIYCNNMTVNVGVTIKPAWYRIFVAGTLTNNGTISNNGGNGGNATNAAANTAGVWGTAGATPIAGVTVFSSGWAGTAGANGRNTNGNGTAAGNPTSTTNSVGNAGGTGGIGGAGGANVGWTGGSSTATTSGTNGIKDLTLALVMLTTAGVVKAGTGGGGGGGGGVQENGAIGSGATWGGGGGGWAGWVVYISCFALAGNGVINATGGTGGTGSNAFAGTAASTGMWWGSGGGGGAGWVVIIITKTTTNPNTVSVAAGAGGTGGTGQTTWGVVGANGVSGSTWGAWVAVYFVI